jgi:hypothetical protein
LRTVRSAWIAGKLAACRYVKQRGLSENRNEKRGEFEAFFRPMV